MVQNPYQNVFSLFSLTMPTILSFKIVGLPCEELMFVRDELHHFFLYFSEEPSRLGLWESETACLFVLYELLGSKLAREA